MHFIGDVRWYECVHSVDSEDSLLPLVPLLFYGLFPVLIPDLPRERE